MNCSSLFQIGMERERIGAGIHFYAEIVLVVYLDSQEPDSFRMCALMMESRSE